MNTAYFNRHFIFCYLSLSLQPPVYPQATWCGFRKGIMFLYPGIRWKRGTMSQLSSGTRSVSNTCCGCNAKLIATAHAYTFLLRRRYCCVRRGGATARSRGLQTQPSFWPYPRGGRTSLRCERWAKEVKVPPAPRSDCWPPRVSIDSCRILNLFPQSIVLWREYDSMTGGLRKTVRI